MTGGEFFEQFIEDYHAECDEHLATARRALLALEANAPAPPSSVLLRELFRSLHTLKGLSGMVGDACAERVAHALEDSLRSADRADVPLDPQFVDAFFAGVELLERCVAARRAGSAEVDPQPVLDRLAASLRGVSATPSPAVATSPVPADLAPGGIDDVVYHFEFAPSGALAARDVGVDGIRARLSAFGTILEARPRMAGSNLVFDFWVSAPADREPEQAWSGDGLRWMRAELSPARRTVETGPVAAATPETSTPTLATSVARVELSRLDAVMRLVGDLVVSRSRLDELLNENRDLATVRDALDETNAAMERQIRQLRESVMRIRLVPIGEVFERLRFAARDAIRESGKQVVLAFHGQETELDKLVVDRLLEPLLHLVRNAVSHGIERPEERQTHGKAAQGTLTLRAMTAGDRIRVEVEDDGAGIDVEQVARRARAQGLLGASEPLGADRLLEVLCAPGFSTRDDADMTSGRGVGMDVVAATIRTLAGELSVDTAPGLGTRFTIELPLTLMILDALLVEIGAQQMAVPQPALREILQVDASTIVTFENNEVVAYRGGVLPLVNLSRLFGLSVPTRATVYVLVVGSEAAPMGLVVDRLGGLREIVVHPVNDPLVAMPGVAGATELGDGRVSLILDTAALLRVAHEQRERRTMVSAAHRAPVLVS